MKTIEIEIPQVDVASVVDAMAARLLGLATEYGQDGEPVPNESIYGRKQIGQRLREYLDKKMTEMLVREQFDRVIGDRIGAAVDAVMEEDWYQTDDYGHRKGDKLSLKDRISVHLKTVDRYDSNRNTVDSKIKKAVDEAMSKEFGPVIAATGAKLKAELDSAVTTKFAEVVRNALGVR